MASPLTADRFGVRTNLYILTAAMLVVSRLLIASRSTHLSPSLAHHLACPLYFFPVHHHRDLCQELDPLGHRQSLFWHGLGLHGSCHYQLPHRDLNAQDARRHALLFCLLLLLGRFGRIHRVESPGYCELARSICTTLKKSSTYVSAFRR